MSVHFSSLTDQWLTPADLIRRAEATLGGIDLDPAAHAAYPIPASGCRSISPPDDGLAVPWHGRVWANPPYGRTIGAWLAKLVAEQEDARLEAALALLPARTDTAYWHDAVLRYGVFYFRGRIRFETPHPGAPPKVMDYPTMAPYLEDQARYDKALRLHLHPEPAPFPSALVCVGVAERSVLAHFGGLGKYCPPARVITPAWERRSRAG